MELVEVIQILFYLNAILHVVQFRILHAKEDSSAVPVLVFALLNLVLGVLIVRGISWVPWLALALPLFGGSGLLNQMIKSKSKNVLDILILLLDIATVVVACYLLSTLH